MGKPISGNAKDGLEMLNFAHKSQIICWFALIHRFIQAIRYMREIIKSDDLREPIHFHSSYVRLFGSLPINDLTAGLKCCQFGLPLVIEDLTKLIRPAI